MSADPLIHQCSCDYDGVRLCGSLPPERCAAAGPAVDEYEPSYTGDEPLGTCVVHGDYWTDDCLRCGR